MKKVIARALGVAGAVFIILTLSGAPWKMRGAWLVSYVILAVILASAFLYWKFVLGGDKPVDPQHKHLMP